MANTGSTPGFLRDHPDGCSLAVRVQPGAKRTAILGIHGQGAESRLKIALQAPPIDGRANDALVTCLAKLFAIPRSRVRILHGAQDRFKSVFLDKISVPQILAIIQDVLKQPTS